MSGKRVRPPPKARGKKGVVGQSRSKKMDKANEFVAKGTQSTHAAAVATEVTALKAAISGVSTLENARPPLVAALEANDKSTVAAEGALDTAMADYVHTSTNVAAGDAAVLEDLGVPLVAQPAPKATGPAGVVTGISCLPGTVVGSNVTRWKRPGRAGAFLAQYKLEPGSVPAGSPAPDWTPPNGHPTSNVEWTILGLPPAADLRVRICAIGAEVGPWSDEVLGKAR